MDTAFVLLVVAVVMIICVAFPPLLMVLGAVAFVKMLDEMSN